MRRLATAALLAAPLLLAGPGVASAHDGPCTFGLGFCGNCLRLFPRIHQHGPLFNYGPYYGYPPFEPYGNWNSYLHYTGPVAPYGGGGGGGYGWLGHQRTWGGNPHPLFHGHGGGLFHGHGGHKHGRKHGGAGGCDTCGDAAAQYVTSGNVLDRYSGYGDPAASTAYYASGPQLTTQAGVVPVGFWSR